MQEEVYDELGKALRERIFEEGRSRLGKRWRCPRELKQRVLEFARQRRYGGMPIKTVADELGLDNSTLARWIRDEKVGGGFRQVAIVPSDEGPEEPFSGGQRLALISPRGFRLEGLDAGAAIALFRELG